LVIKLDIGITGQLAQKAQKTHTLVIMLDGEHILEIKILATITPLLAATLLRKIVRDDT